MNRKIITCYLNGRYAPVNLVDRINYLNEMKKELLDSGMFITVKSNDSGSWVCTRYENDEEYNKRMTANQKRKLSNERRKEREKEKRKKEYEKLKKEFENG